MSFFDKTKPLGLPDGSIRAVLAIITVGATIAVLVNLALDTGKVPDMLTVLGSTAFGWYFGTRSAQPK